MDNFSLIKSGIIREIINYAEFQVKFLPHYSPMFNQIDEVFFFSKCKISIRARNCNDLAESIIGIQQYSSGVKSEISKKLQKLITIFRNKKYKI